MATLCGGRRRTWGEFHRRVSALAHGLKHTGVQRGDRIAILAHNSDHYLEALFATLWTGALTVPLNTRWSPAELAYALRDSGSVALFADSHFLDVACELSKTCADVKHVIDLDSGKNAGLTLNSLIDGQAGMADAGGSGSDAAGIFYTGGTTGAAKGAVLTHGGIMANGLMLATIMGLGEETRFLHAAPMFHVADISFAFSVTAMAGTHVILPYFDPHSVAKTIGSESVTHTMLVPTMISMLLDHCDNRGADVTGLRTLIYGASPMSEALLVRTMESLPRTDLIQGYGQTELSPVATVLEPRFHGMRDDMRHLLRSAGRPLPCVDVKIVDDGREVLPGEVGEIWVRGPSTMAGYWNLPDLTMETIVDDWVRTGDMGRIDGEGFLYVVDRLKDMIVSGGENVYSAEVENAIAKHPAVAACAVIGVPDEKWGERVHAIISARTALTEAQIVDHCRDLLAAYKCPRSVEIRAEPLPLSAAGKILKKELRDAYWTGRERAVN